MTRSCVISVFVACFFSASICTETSALPSRSKLVKCAAIISVAVSPYIIGGGLLISSRFSSPQKMLDREIKKIAPSGPQRVAFTHIGQMHRVPIEDPKSPKWNDIKDIEKSQADIAKILLKAKSMKRIGVAAEGLTVLATPQLREKIQGEMDSWEKPFASRLREEWSVEEEQLVYAYRGAKRAFPDGWPKDEAGEYSENLNQSQIQALGDYGADRILWALGELDYLYPAEDLDLNDKAFQKSRKHFTSSDPTIFRDREVKAVTLIYPIILSEKFDEFFLVYGMGHDFKKYNNDWLSITATE